MRILLVSLALLAAPGHAAFAQPAPPLSEPPAETTPPSQMPPEPGQKMEPPAVQPGSGPQVGPILPPPQPPTIEGSPAPAALPAEPLPPPPSTAPPLRQETARVSPEAATYLQEIGIDPNAPNVVEVSQDNVGAFSLDSLAAERDETRVRRFIYTRTFMHRFLADPDNVRIEPDKYDIAFLTPEEVNLITDLLNK